MSEASADVCAPWADAADACFPCSEYAFDPALLEDGIAVASEILWNLTGRRWSGICTDTIRPPSACGCVVRGAWGDGMCGCGCGGVSEIILPSYPAVDVTDVTIDGAVVDPARYRIDDHQRLVYQPDLSDPSARQHWPCCQAGRKPAGEVGTWSITYTHGQEPPLGGIKAAASYGCQLALACSGDDEAVAACRLPLRTTSVVRQQLTLALVDPLMLVQEGLVGLAEVDGWVMSVLRGDSRRRGHVFVPGRKARARRTTAT